MSVMVLAAGNSIIKAKITRREQGEITFPHAIQQITQAEYTNILSRSKTARISSNYIRVNGQAYVVGESAERYSITIKRSGAARYIRAYYGILAAAAFGRLYDRSREVSVFASHASGDARFREIRRKPSSATGISKSAAKSAIFGLFMPTPSMSPWVV